MNNIKLYEPSVLRSYIPAAYGHVQKNVRHRNIMVRSYYFWSCLLYKIEETTLVIINRQRLSYLTSPNYNTFSIRKGCYKWPLLTSLFLYHWWMMLFFYGSTSNVYCLGIPYIHQHPDFFTVRTFWVWTADYSLTYTLILYNHKKR